MSHSELPGRRDPSWLDEPEDMMDLQAVMQKYSDSPFVHDVDRGELWVWDAHASRYRRASSNGSDEAR